MTTDRDSKKSEFYQAYQNLNPGQKQAVDTIEGPVMVIAGPGTGKTQILALRVANILMKTDTKPENILALTFTDAGAHAMRERCRRYIGEEGYRVVIRTFHSLAEELIRNYPDAYPDIIGRRPAGDIERTAILENIIEGAEIDLLRPAGDPFYYIKKIPSAIADLKKENVSPDNLTALINQLEETYSAMPKFHEKGVHKGKIRADYQKNEKHISKLRELAVVYRLYEAALTEKRLFDFEDMIVKTVLALRENEDMLRDLQETYQYILADEHQDVNEGQNQILELLASYHEQPNIFVVGDEKQSIYRFQGASLRNFLYFEQRFPGTRVISLTDNYRSSQAILDASHSLIQSDDEDLKKLRVPLKAARVSNNFKPQLRTFSHEAVEDDWVISQVKETIAEGIPMEEIAIILRNNKDVLRFTDLLRQSSIDAKPSADNDILDHPLTLAIENLLRAVGRPNDQEALFDLLLSDAFDIQKEDAIALILSRTSNWPIGRLFFDAEKIDSLDLRAAEKVKRVAEILKTAAKKSLIEPPHYILQFLLKETGLLDRLIATDPIESVRVLRRLYDDLEALVTENGRATVAEAIKLLRYRRTHSLPLLAPFIDSDKTAVNVMTAHKSKGLEFHTVIIPRATDSLFGGSRDRDTFKLPLYQTSDISRELKAEDEKRLFYVAMTRAKEKLFVSSSETNSLGKLQEISRFLLEIPEEKIEKVSTAEVEENFDQAKILSNNVKTNVLDSETIKGLFLRRGLSVTHLNNYLEDPHKYYLENLLRRPQPQSLSLIKGNCVHEVLDRVVSIYTKSGEWPSESDVISYLKNAFDKKAISDHDAVRLNEKALGSLIPYINHLKSMVDQNVKTEYRVNTVLPTSDPEIPEIPLNGNLDRIDLDQEGKVLRVVDYKTGKPKSQNEIEGKTKNSTGNYKRQLAFYALLFTLSRPEEPRPKEYTISFIEPKKEGGDVVEYSFSITDEEIEKLKETIIQVVKEIISGEKF